jgi:hypothetical protein
MYEADLREGTIAAKDRLGDLRVLSYDVGPAEMPDALCKERRDSSNDSRAAPGVRTSRRIKVSEALLLSR